MNEGAVRDRSDGIRLAWKDKWLQVRASNTEPIVRVIAEAGNRGDAESLAGKAMEEIRRVIGD